MPFGKFYPAKSEIITNMHGEKVPLNTPAGYGGLFWGRVFGEDGKHIKYADDYFMELAESNGEEDEFVYWEIIDSEIGKHCEKYIEPIYKKSNHHHYQYGFGGDESSGLIDFWLPEQIPEMPSLQFKIKDKTYTLRWEYSSGDD